MHAGSVFGAALAACAAIFMAASPSFRDGWRMFCTSRRRAAKGRLACPRTGSGTGDAACLDLDARWRPAAPQWRKTHWGLGSARITVQSLCLAGGKSGGGRLDVRAAIQVLQAELIEFAPYISRFCTQPASESLSRYLSRRARQEICTRAASHLKIKRCLVQNRGFNRVFPRLAFRHAVAPSRGRNSAS